jgi:hypothetical protein
MATLENWHFFEGMLLFIGFTDGDIVQIEGSGVLVAPGIALCATHVIEPHVAHLMDGAGVATCFGIASHGLQIWNVRKITSVPNTDLTIIGLKLTSALPPENRFFQSILSTRTPSVGEELIICGFRPGMEVVSQGRNEAELSGDMWISKGAVKEGYPLGRDRSMIPWPALAVDVSSRGGMSGGPVYDRNGLLIGPLCSSLDSGDDSGISYVSMLWPALTTRFEGCWPSGFYRSSQSLLELDRRICAVDKPEAIEATYKPSGRVHTQYHPWT